MTIELSTIDWPAVLVGQGINEGYLKKKAGPCPICEGGTDRFRFDNKGGMGTWFCSKCGAGNGYTLLKRYTGKPDWEVVKILLSNGAGASADLGLLPARPPAICDDYTPEKVAKNREVLSKAVKRSILLTGTDPVSRYIANRVPGCDLSKISSDIRCHPGMDFYDQDENDQWVKCGRHPVMLARVVDAAGVPVTLHRTYLTVDGKKAPYDKVKKQMKGVRKLAGDAIRLVKNTESRTLGLTEGIETGIAVATGYNFRINVWSMLNCVNLSLTELPPGQFDKIIIFADHDELDTAKGYRPGMHYAMLLKARLEQQGYEVEIKLPVKVGTDFADVWVEFCEARTAKAKAGRDVAAATGRSSGGVIHDRVAPRQSGVPIPA